MANKNHYYVLVFTTEGPVYVTSIDNIDKYASWDKDKDPMEFSEAYAKELVMGLNMNFNSAVLVKSPHRIIGQPYRYDVFDCEFVEKTIIETDE